MVAYPYRHSCTRIQLPSFPLHDVIENTLLCDTYNYARMVSFIISIVNTGVHAYSHTHYHIITCTLMHTCTNMPAHLQSAFICCSQFAGFPLTVGIAVGGSAAIVLLILSIVCALMCLCSLRKRPRPGTSVAIGMLQRHNYS